ncbi:P1 family peptidase [Gymnodinialimonas ceratoperidinii]|uniref:P1 family peptidase n=1 Tax=Gymnodinialimonas ceratoperidinii TaxID=2856823 RepID=A0A8F6YC10_9RHOB|nr:P1 family peptidase [Gymnodinialimonas ceratoperidinii]QXT41484.1 P1 family peptidase [Gymnodinialimonas ceratoperidinii]
MQPGKRNLITDVAGLRVGHAADAGVKTGATVLVGDAPFTAGVHVMGGAPGTRETDLLAPDKTVQQADALVLSGGSAFGLDAASGVADALRAAGRGFAVGDQVVPIVPAAILFDLINGGDKDWAENPYKQLGREALAAAGADFALGSVGAGTGALTADLKGGLGSASLRIGRHTVGALVAVNALGRVTVGDGPCFWAAPFEMGGEFGGRGIAKSFDVGALPPVKGGDARNTTIAIVATDAALSQAQATRLAVAAHDGMARAIFPSHTPMDGDLVFAAATGAVPLESEADLLMLGHGAALCLSRAIARGVFEASAAAGDVMPTYRDKFG